MEIDIDKLILEAAKQKLSARDLYPISELDAYLAQAKVDLNKKYEKAKFIVQFIEDNGKLKDVLSLGNISGTIGGAKSKKTFFSTIILSSLSGNEPLFGLKVDTDNRGVVFIDTEQAIYHVQRVGNRVKKLINKFPNKLEILALRQYPETELRVALVEHYLKEHAGEYSFVIIDGLVDLVSDYNDQAESRYMVSKLLAWSAKYNCHINAVLHLNKDLGHARGHLGAELINKSETIFKVTKEDDSTSTVECEASRNEAFKQFSFIIEDGLPKRPLMPTGYYDNGITPKVNINYSEPIIIDQSAGFEETDDLPF